MKAYESADAVQNGNLSLLALPGPISVSFEFFPPRTAQMVGILWECIRRLEPLAPRFVSVTYGASGSTRERTHDTVVRIARETSLKPAAHLTCVGASRAEVDHIAHRYWEAGIRHIVALRGDPPERQNHYVPHADGYAYAVNLVRGLKTVADFEITVAAYPEAHPEAPSAAFDLDNLKRKIDAGASRAITQYFFDIDVYRRFMDKVRAAGITVPVIPGILPVTNVATMLRFSQACGTAVPSWVHALFDGLDADPDTRRLVAAVLAAEQCRALVTDGVTDFHFYTLNRADLVFAICHILGVRQQWGSKVAADRT
ncbi:5,10-methylenetetrahydrofolate reductase [invertebrate metagenome]|uniref:methylenetetrahydrofolate reductase (NADH) n=1 Tax=invertebrate metagenome TaxID=1711999 RepID=A0A484HAY5_9ZZZZ